jgi:hypothetical protein
VHSAWAGSSTRLAGFSADGVLYFETAEGPGRSSVNAWIPHRKERRELSGPEAGFVLTAVPARLASEDERPWAMGAHDGVLAALQSEEEPKSLNLDDAVFVPREGADIWAVSTASTSNNDRTLRLARIVPRWSEQLRSLAFDAPDQPEYVEAELGSPPRPDSDPKPLEEKFGGPALVCMSTGAPGGWAYSCGSASDRNFLAAPTTPSTEDPFGNPFSDPEVPPVDESWQCGEAPRLGEQGFYCMEVNGCCYRNEVTACAVAACSSGCEFVPQDGYTSARCK